jgi:hypothetical protein
MSMTEKKLNTVKPALVTTSIKQKLVLCDLNLYFPSQYMSAVHRGFEPRSGQTKDYKIGICYFSTDWLAQN